MAFKKIILSKNEMCEDIEYLRKKQYRGLFGRSIPKTVEDYYKDEEKNAYLLEIGCTNPNFETEGYMFHIFVLCIDGNMIGIGTQVFSTGKIRENTLEEKWAIRFITYPEGWDDKKYPDFKDTVTEAFKSVTLYYFDKPEGVKNVEVIFDEFTGKWW